MIIAVSFISSTFEGISIGMLVPLLSGLLQVQNYDQLPKILELIVKPFKKYSIENQIILSVGLALIAILLKNLFLAISINLGYWFSGKVVSELRIQTINTLMSAGLEFFNRTKAGHLVEKVLNHTKNLDSLIKHTIEFIVNFASLFVLTCLLFIFSWKLTLISLAFTVIIGLIMSINIKTLSKISSETAKRSRDLSGSLFESISGINVIKSFVKEPYITSVLGDKVEKLRKIEFQLSLRSYSIHILTEVFSIIAITLLFFIVMIKYEVDSRIIITMLLPFIYIISRLIPIIKKLNGSRGEIASKLPYLDLVYDLIRLDNKPVIHDGRRPFLGLKSGISFKSVRFSYNNDDKFALYDADFYMPKGKATAIIGESGAGKSTIINLLLRFYDPQGGVILIDQQPLKKFKIDSYRSKIGVVSQDTFIFNDSVKNNIAFGATESQSNEAIIETAKKAGAHDFIMELPEAYNTILGDRGIGLSGGQRQRISIARAILKNPEILILDEATSSLDIRTEKLIHNSISELSRNRTVIIIAHRLSTIQGADQIIVLKRGLVVEIGQERDLINSRGEYYKLANTQTL